MMDFSTSYPFITIVRIAPEILLKGPATRKRFQKQLRANIKDGLKARGIEHEIITQEGRFLLNTSERDGALEVLDHTFGVFNYSPIDEIVDGGLEVHKTRAEELYKDLVAGKAFAVRIKRMGLEKKHSSPHMEREIGGQLYPYARKVDLTNPEVTVRADVVGDVAYFYTKKIEGPGGLPIGIQGHAVTLISGGFDSVVAAWYLMKRGAMIDFVFCNLAGSAYERMVLEVTKVLCDGWATGTRPRLYCVDFETVIADLKASSQPEWWQIILKRQMYRAGCDIAKRIGADAIVTGEALGQVSSQTLSNLNTIDEVADLPVLRPLISFDKHEIIRIAQKIGTDKLSQKIPEFCALNKKSPAVQSARDKIMEEETRMHMDILTQAVEDAKVYKMQDVDDADLAQHAVFIDKIPEDAIVMDCQPEDLYETWHVPGAQHYTAGHLMNNLKALDKTITYVLYCPFGTQSAVLAEKMQKAGFEAYSYKGGIRQLKKLYPDQAA